MNFYLPLLDDSIDAVDVEFMRWRLYWLHHKGDPVPSNVLGTLLSAKEMNTYRYSSLEVLLNIDNWSGYYSNK